LSKFVFLAAIAYKTNRPTVFKKCIKIMSEQTELNFQVGAVMFAAKVGGCRGRTKPLRLTKSGQLVHPWKQGSEDSFKTGALPPPTPSQPEEDPPQRQRSLTRDVPESGAFIKRSCDRITLKPVRSPLTSRGPSSSPDYHFLTLLNFEIAISNACGSFVHHPV